MATQAAETDNAEKGLVLTMNEEAKIREILKKHLPMTIINKPNADQATASLLKLITEACMQVLEDVLKPEWGDNAEITFVLLSSNPRDRKIAQKLVELSELKSKDK